MDYKKNHTCISQDNAAHKQTFLFIPLFAGTLWNTLIMASPQCSQRTSVFVLYQAVTQHVRESKICFARGTDSKTRSPESDPEPSQITTLPTSGVTPSLLRGNAAAPTPHHPETTAANASQVLSIFRASTHGRMGSGGWVCCSQAVARGGLSSRCPCELRAQCPYPVFPRGCLSLLPGRGVSLLSLKTVTNPPRTC